MISCAFLHFINKSLIYETKSHFQMRNMNMHTLYLSAEITITACKMLRLPFIIHKHFKTLQIQRG